jgi:Glycosyltransferase family 87
MNTDKKTALCFLPLLLLLIVALIRSTLVPWSDFAGYYFGGRELLSGHYGNAYDMQNLNFLIAAAGYHGVFVSYAPFPPFTSLVFAPFLAFPLGVSKLLFNSFSAIFFLFSLFRCRKFFAISGPQVLLLTVVFYTPMVNNLFFGQSYLLLCALLLEGYMAYKQDRIVLSAVLWALAVVFKVFPAVILLFLLLKKKYRQAAWLCAACAFLLLLSLLLNGWPAWKYYVTEILPKVNNGELNNSFTFMFQSAFMLLKKLFVYDTLLNPHPLYANAWLFTILAGLFKAFILTACIVFTIREKDRDFDSFAVWIMGSMLISPNGSSYSLILLLIPLLALMARKTLIGSLIPALVLWAACYIPVYRLENAPTLLQFPRLYLLLLFFVLLLPLRKAWHPALWGALSLLFIAPSLIPHRNTDTSTYFLQSEQHIFIYDYAVSNDRLVYSYWDDQGAVTVSTGFQVTSVSNEGLEIKDRQIWFKGKQLTASPDVKKKPLLINGTFILYLSDKNRGPGFYTLRQLIPPGQG